MAFIAHDLLTFDKANDRYKVTLYIDDTIGTLTVPSLQTIVNISDLGGALDKRVGVSDIQSVTFEILDEYGTYSEGFWYKALAKDAEIRILVDEGKTGTYKSKFHGQIQEETLDWQKFEKADGSARRKASFEATSILNKLKNVDASDWWDEVYAQRALTGLEFSNQIYSVITYKNALAALMKVAFNGTFNSNDCELIYDTSNPDIELKEGSTWYKLADFCLPVEVDKGLDPSHDIQKVAYFDSGSTIYLPNQWSKAYDLLARLAANFAQKIHVYYNDSTSRYHIQSIQPGRAYSGTISISEKPKQFNEIKDSDLVALGVQAYRWRNEAEVAWIHEGEIGLISTTAVPSNLEFDIVIPLIYSVNISASFAETENLVRSNGSKFTDARFWRYDIGSTTTSSTSRKMAEIIASYLFYKFKHNKNILELLYKTLKASDGATTSLFHIDFGKRMMIDSKTYYVNEYRMNIKEQELFLQMIQE